METVMKIVHRKASIVGMVLAAVSLVMAGCQYAPARAERDKLDRDTYPQISLHEDLRGAIVVADVIENPGPPYRVTVALRSRTSTADRLVQYRFIYLDSSGQPIGDEAGWLSERFPARTEKFIKSNALDRGATDWRMEIRPAR